MGATNTNVSGVTNLDVHIFVDEYGNVTQTNKSSKTRLKYYIDPKVTQNDNTYCAIGISDEDWGPCTNGTALGIGNSMMAYANYGLPS